MRLLSAILVTAAFCVPNLPSSASAADTPETTIDRVEEFDEKGLHIRVADPVNPAGIECPNGNGWIRVDPDSPAYNELLSIAMAALLSGKRVVVRVYDSECFGGWPKLRMIELRR